MNVLCIHPALAPYRLDFFNLLAERVDLDVAFVHKNVVNQKFDQAKLIAQAKFRYRYLSGFDIKGRNIRFGIGRLIRECKPDVVLTYEASLITMWLCVLKMFHVGKWRLWTSMDEAPETITSRQGIRAKVRNWVLRHCDGVIVPSNAAAEAYRSVLISRLSAIASAAADPSSPLTTNHQSLTTNHHRFAIVPIIHDTATIRKNAEAVIISGKEWRNKFVPSEWGKVLLFVGRLTKVKNLHWLIEQMVKLDDGIGLVLVGSGDEEAALKVRVADKGLSKRVLFAGKKEGDELYAIMSTADALVLPSTFEPYGAVVAEAMQWGTPVAVSDKVGAKELIRDGENGAVIGGDFGKTVMHVMGMKKGANSILVVELKSYVNALTEAFEA